MTDPSDNKPKVDWFPGLHTGPAVGIGVTVSEIELLRHMLDDTPDALGDPCTEAKYALRDLDVRYGALLELDSARTHEVVMKPGEHAAMRMAFEEYGRFAGNRRRYDEVAALMVQLDRRLGAAQVRLAQSGMMTEEEHFPNRVTVVDDEWTPPPPRNSRPRFGWSGRGARH